MRGEHIGSKFTKFYHKMLRFNKAVKQDKYRYDYKGWTKKVEKLTEEIGEAQDIDNYFIMDKDEMKDIIEWSVKHLPNATWETIAKVVYDSLIEKEEQNKETEFKDFNEWY